MDCLAWFTLADASRVAPSILCKAFGADVEQKACDTNGALVGCDKNYQDAWRQAHWYWPAEQKTMASDFSCSSNETRLGADRMPLAE